jgi:hypothetical protein
MGNKMCIQVLKVEEKDNLCGCFIFNKHRSLLPLQVVFEGSTNCKILPMNEGKKHYTFQLASI